MAEDPEERVADEQAESSRRERRLNREQSSQSPDEVETYNRRADAKRENYSKANYYESRTEDETERKARQD